MLTAIVQYVARERVPPTVEELSHELRVSLAVVHRWIERLEAEGAVESLWVAGRRSPRSLRVVASDTTNSAAERGSHSTPQQENRP